MFKVVDGQLYREFNIEQVGTQEMIDLIEQFFNDIPEGTIEKVVPNFKTLLNIYGDPMQAVAHLPHALIKKITIALLPKLGDVLMPLDVAEAFRPV